MGAANLVAGIAGPAGDTGSCLGCLRTCCLWLLAQVLVKPEQHRQSGLRGHDPGKHKRSRKEETCTARGDDREARPRPPLVQCKSGTTSMLWSTAVL